jgi:hypothetical protein
MIMKKQSSLPQSLKLLAKHKAELSPSYPQTIHVHNIWYQLASVSIRFLSILFQKKIIPISHHIFILCHRLTISRRHKPSSDKPYQQQKKHPNPDPVPLLLGPTTDSRRPLHRPSIQIAAAARKTPTLPISTSATRIQCESYFRRERIMAEEQVWLASRNLEADARE